MVGFRCGHLLPTNRMPKRNLCAVLPAVHAARQYRRCTLWGENAGYSLAHIDASAARSSVVNTSAKPVIPTGVVG